MAVYEDFFKGKKVTILGLGLLGRSVGDAEFIAQYAREVVVTDKKTETELAESVERLRKHPNIIFRLGGHCTEDFTDTDIVIKSAGVRMDNPEIAAARAASIPVFMSTALFARFAIAAGATIVGVTGTRGKSTVSHLIYHCLKEDARRVFLGGNIRGLSTLALIPEIKAEDICVLELDSWQLQGFGDLKISPDVAVFTNLMPDHQNYYPSMDEYFTDKAQIFLHQKQGDTLVCGESILSTIEAAQPPVAPIVPPMLPEDWVLKIPGEHNRENASLAIAALEALAIPEKVIRSGVESFEGVEGRLQLVREIDGVRIYNDNNATTPDATIAALHALDSGAKNIVLIMGGSDKGLDMGKLLYEIATTCKRVILLAGTGTDRVVPLMQDYSVYDNLEQAVREAFGTAEKGDSVLFSPAFASFGMFKNEYERNDQFLSIVQSL